MINQRKLQHIVDTVGTLMVNTDDDLVLGDFKIIREQLEELLEFDFNDDETPHVDLDWDDADDLEHLFKTFAGDDWAYGKIQEARTKHLLSKADEVRGTGNGFSALEYEEAAQQIESLGY